MTSQRRLPTDRFLFGGDYNPEQWPEEVWQEDVALMHRAGVNTVTVGVFSWSVLEPAEGRYEFGWLDRVLDLMHAHDVGVFLATPTASPPPWFTRAYPDALPVGPDGVRLTHGSRDTYSISSPDYRRAARRITGELARRYAQHPALLGWHLHNEYGSYDWGPHAAAAFRRWLQRRHGSLDALNRAWYTAFWSQRYSDWEDVLPPRATQYLANPTQGLDFRRFMSDEMLDAFREQQEEVLAAGSTVPVTTNFMLPTWNHLEQWSWSAALDVVSMDHYLDTDGPDGETHAAYGSDLSRSWGRGAPWLLMEQSTTSSTLPGRRVHKETHRVIRNSLSYIARGSQGALFFQWRAPAAGAEVWHGGIVPHVGADSASFEGFTELGRVLESIREVAEPPATGPVVEADVAIVWHAEGWWATEVDHLPSGSLDYSDAVRSTHRALWHAGIAVDFVSPDAPLEGYRLVLVPSLYALDDAAVANVEAFVRGGGHLAVWPFTGFADENLHVAPGGYPGRLRELLGVRVEELHPLDAAEEVRLELAGGTACGTGWSERLTSTGAQVVGRYPDGSPALTRHAVGSGVAHYVSTFLDPASLQDWLVDLTREALVSPPLGAAPPAGIEVVVRRGAHHEYLFVLNHTAQTVTLTGRGHDLVSDRACVEGFAVEGFGWAVVRLADRDGWRWGRPTRNG